MLMLKFCPEGKAVSDFSAEEAAMKLYEASLRMEDDFKVKVSTENIITAARVLIKEGDISYDKICFLFEEYELHPNKDGRLEKWPKGFCDFDDKWLNRLIDWEAK